MASDSWDLIDAPTRAHWRAWLERNHAKTESVWLILHKKGSTSGSLRYADARDEALCFGWIDSRTNRLDDTRYKIIMSPRKPKSVWSAVNKQRLIELEAAGLIAPPGRAAIELARRNGSWEAVDSVERQEVPGDLAALLDASPEARANFEAFAPSVRKPLLQWLLAAKRPETRQKRLEAIVQAALERRSPLTYTPPSSRSGSNI